MIDNIFVYDSVAQFVIEPHECRLHTLIENILFYSSCYNLLKQAFSFVLFYFVETQNWSWS